MKWIKRVFYVFMVLLAFIAVGIGYLYYDTKQLFDYYSYGKQFQEQAKGDVEGNFSGIPVLIPNYQVNSVGYNDDPDFGESRITGVPIRAADSGIRWIGFDVRLSDSATLSTPELILDKKIKTAANTDWSRGSIYTGMDYPGDNFMQRWYQSFITYKGSWRFNYQLLPQQKHDLMVFVLTESDPETGVPYRQRRDTYDVYIHLDKNRKVTTRIKCSNAPVKSAPCVQTWSLSSVGIRAKVQLTYRRGLISGWENYQANVTKLILSWITS